VLSGRGLCNELISHPDEFYRLWCVVVCDLETWWMRRLWPTGGSRAKKETKDQICGIKYGVFFFHPRFSKHHAPYPAFRDLFTCNSEECLRQRSISWDSSSLKKKLQGFCSISPYFLFMLCYCILFVDCALLLSKSNWNPIGRPVNTLSSTKGISFYALIRKVHFKFPGNTRLELNEIRSSFDHHGRGNHLRAYGASCVTWS